MGESLEFATSRLLVCVARAQAAALTASSQEVLANPKDLEGVGQGWARSNVS